MPKPDNYIYDVQQTTYNYCSGKEQKIEFSTKGNFDANTEYSLQISDENGENFKDFGVKSKDKNFKFIIPDFVKRSVFYRYRVLANAPAAQSSASRNPTFHAPSVIGKLTGSGNLIKGDSAKISIDFTAGTPPFKYFIQAFSGDTLSGTTYVSPKNIFVKPSLSESYRLFQVSNAECGIGKAEGTAIIKLELVSVASPDVENPISVFPNPTSDKILINLNNFKAENYKIQLFDNAGNLVKEIESTENQAEIDLKEAKTGIYLLNLQAGRRKIVYRIVKE